MKATLSTVEPFARSIMRVVIGFTFSCHGSAKLFGILGGMNGHGARASVFTLMWAAGLIETIGGILILAGLFTNVVAFILCGEMAVAYFTVHAPHGHWPLQNGGELAVIYCFVFFYLLFAGAGPLSFDSAFRRKQRPPRTLSGPASAPGRRPDNP
jgi:putative oxidoreductase